MDLIPLNKNKTEYDGFVEANGESYRIRIHQVQSDTMKDARISCDWKLRHLLHKHLELLKGRLQQSVNITQFMADLKLLLESSVEGKSNDIWQPNYYDIILTHLQELGWEKLKDISEDFMKIDLKIIDECDREHFLTLKLSPEYPKKPPDVLSLLPIHFHPLWADGATFITLYDQYKLNLQLYQRLWDEVDELKQRTWILEPENPNFAATSFRIALGRSSSLQVTVDPLNCGVLPACHFLGPDWAISELQDRFHEKSSDWNETISLYQNLRNTLQIDFPTKDISKSPDVSLQCGICYAFRLGADIPDQICGEKRCSQAFHHQCLLEWIRSIPGAKQSFNVIFGECPYCTTSIKLHLLPT